MIKVEVSDHLYSDQIRNFFQTDFPSKFEKSSSDTLNLVAEAILSSGKIRGGSKMTDVVRRIRDDSKPRRKKKLTRDYVIIRTRSAGVFAGNLKSRKGTEVVLLNARRLWYWAGAASLSQLAMSGVSRPDDCKFPEEMSKVILPEVIEIIDVSEKAEQSIKGVKVWQN
jgi:hypothetical protein